MERSLIRLGREQRLKVLSCGVHFFLAAALTASRMPGGHAPFALGCVAASGTGVESLAALLGTTLGAVLFFDFEEALPHLAAAVLILTAGRTFRGSRLVVSRRMLSMLAATVFLTVSIKSSPGPGNQQPRLALFSPAGTAQKLSKPRK